MQSQQAEDLALAAWAESCRQWGLSRTAYLYSTIDTEDIDSSFARIMPLLLSTYWLLRVRALTVMDDYWRLRMLRYGQDLRFDWRQSRATAPARLPSGMAFAEHQARAPLGVKSLIGSGITPADAVRTSLGRTSVVVGTAVHLDVRTTSLNRAAAIETARERPAAAVEPGPAKPWLDEIAAPSQRFRRYEPAAPLPPLAPSTRFDYVFQPPEPEPEPERVETVEPDWRLLPRLKYRRVPSPGACAFCLTLASRGAVYESARAALYRRGGGRYHPNCRCYAVVSGTVRERMAISRADYDRLLTEYQRGPRKGEPRTFNIGRHSYTLADIQGSGGIATYEGDEPPWPKF